MVMILFILASQMIYQTLMLSFFVIGLLLVVALKLLLKSDSMIDRRTQERREEINQSRLYELIH